MNSDAVFPNAVDCMPVNFYTGLHPTLCSLADLSSKCDLRTQRRSGPGGQHRNKTSSGVFLLHSPTGVTAEATERRSQADNRRVALARMRLKLAVEVRTESALHAKVSPEEEAARKNLVARKLRVSTTNEDFAPLLAMLLNDLHAAGGQPSLLGRQWAIGTSSLVRFLKTHPPAFSFVNAVRGHHRRLPLR